MERVGVIGLGVMGGPMAANLVRAGFEVTGFNRSPAAVERLVAAGGRAGASVAEVVERSTVVLTVLPDSPDVERVVLGEDGVLAHAAEGLLLVDCSTVRPGTSTAVAAAARERGVRTLDAPVSGGETGAVNATLSIMVGGEAEDVTRARPVLQALGTTVVHVGGHGAGQTVKAANQLLVGGISGLLSEAIVLIERSGIDPAPALSVLAGGLAGNRFLDLKSEGMLRRDFAPGFRSELHLKDLGIALAAAREAGVALPMTGLVAQLFAALVAQGRGGQDHSAMLALIKGLSGGPTGAERGRRETTAQ
ncbi:NAD(P)-dependent oxidoreductase [Streptomyces millisiae]|uniref:NAD(P)-dependent oxidoreductase n=1 Tax=Streptomyces millisiae TaxID=3075542 RepID=A0ABU2LIK1_9ACTN|nr:NAD(P)-dependent oxidoreductase [Streptomyces sp. DSM 44918]MDT0316963.1 NAD(P)-dependent oxidoreductase [Streptomyces sp. DSM 44918]